MVGQSHRRELTKRQNKLLKLQVIKDGDHAGWQEAGIVQDGAGRIKNDFMFMLKVGQGEKYTKYKKTK